nr:ABC transporter ATP-binding protein [Kofleriaceae bacterium]
MVTEANRPREAWLRLAAVDVVLGKRAVLRGVTAAVAAGELVAVVGPNGAGKTTLARASAGLIGVAAGAVACFGVDPAKGVRRQIARDLAYLPQHYELAFPFSVLDVVLLGRFAQQRGLAIASDADLAAATAAMAACDVADLGARPFDELSGGEARRVLLAQALCQGARLLVLDEPTAGLDPAHARSVMAAVRARCAGGAVAAVVVTHDLDLALRHATRMWLVADGRLAADGPPREVLAADATRAAFGLAIHVGELPGGEPFAVPEQGSGLRDHG